MATSETAYHYFAMYLIMHAMQEAGSVDDPRAIRAAIPRRWPRSIPSTTPTT
ncbi:hypothetical protein HML84_00135 [Alcanivorax sp. IO_7]|nr:hypothetical protein HML84_00135 [Alcanivorax sp. IO_7]